MKRTIEFDTTLTLVDTETECVEVAVKVAANYFPGSPAVFYMRNGDPGHPEEPDEVEITKVTRKDNGEELEWDSLPESCKDALDEAARESVHRNACDDDGPPERDYEPEDAACREEHFTDAMNDR